MHRRHQNRIFFFKKSTLHRSHTKLCYSANNSQTEACHTNQHPLAEVFIQAYLVHFLIALYLWKHYRIHAF